MMCILNNELRFTTSRREIPIFKFSTKEGKVQQHRMSGYEQSRQRILRNTHPFFLVRIHFTFETFEI